MFFQGSTEPAKLVQVSFNCFSQETFIGRIGQLVAAVACMLENVLHPQADTLAVHLGLDASCVVNLIERWHVKAPSMPMEMLARKNADKIAIKH